jgi:hypothetical protein
MKIRTGFVSNSSSSSFTMIGVSLSDKDLTGVREELQKLLAGYADEKRSSADMLDELCFKERNGMRIRNIDGCDCMLGFEFGGSDCGEIEETSMAYLTEKAEIVSAFLKKIGIEKTPSLFSGEICC